MGMDERRMREIRKIATKGVMDVAISSTKPETRMMAFEHLRTVAEKYKEAAVINAIRYLAAEGSEEISSEAKKYLLRRG